MTDEWVARALATLPDARHYDAVYSGEAVDVLKPDGALLFALRPRAVPYVVAKLAFRALERAAQPTNRRPAAAGGAAKFRSGTVGALDGRPVAFTRRYGWGRIGPLFGQLDEAFAGARPAEYAVLRRAARRTPKERLIPGTVFTSAAVNLDARCAIHPDAGNLPGGYAAMTVLDGGDYSGGLLVFPRYRAAVEIRFLDLLICDNAEPHGNTEIVGAGRFSVVAYYHASNLPADP
jgi:hypothetical protein